MAEENQNENAESQKTEETSAEQSRVLSEAMTGITRKSW